MHYTRLKLHAGLYCNMYILMMIENNANYCYQENLTQFVQFDLTSLSRLPLSACSRLRDKITVSNYMYMTANMLCVQYHKYRGAVRYSNNNTCFIKISRNHGSEREATPGILQHTRPQASPDQI